MLAPGSRQSVAIRSAFSAPIAGAAKVLSDDFTTDYIYHAQMEPHNCLAWVKGDSVEIWSGSQWPSRAREDAAKAAGVAPERVTVHQMQMGGGFGRRAYVEYVVDAVLLSKAAGKPVKMIQSREDDVTHARMRPMTAQRIEIGIDAAGKPVGWRHRIAADTVVPYLYGQARMTAQNGVDHIVFAGADVPHYDVPNHIADHIYEERGIRTAAWRGIGAGHNNFPIEAMIDELARNAGQDPLAYRIALLKDPRAKAAMEPSSPLIKRSIRTTYCSGVRPHGGSTSKRGATRCWRSRTNWICRPAAHRENFWTRPTGVDRSMRRYDDAS